MGLAIKDMLLIEEPTIQLLKDEIMNYSHWFILPSFVFALCLEYFTDLKFGEVIKKLILILTFMSVFYTVHTAGVDLSFKASEEILKKVSPKNIFLRSWTEVKVKTKDSANWNWIQKFAIPNINDLIGTALFILSKIFIWILKLIYSTVYHLTYVFAPLTALLFFFPITRGSIAGTIQSSLWCMFMPIVLVSILAIVGNSIQIPAKEGSLAIISIDHIIWIFGVTILMLMSPILTIGILRGGGVALSGSAIGAMMTNSTMKILKAAPSVAGGIKTTATKSTALGSKALFEPPIRDILKRESINQPNKEKMAKLNELGGLRTPFRTEKSLDERLAKVGMTREEASSLSKITIKTDTKVQANKTSSSAQANRQPQQTFLYDKAFWNKISPEHKASIISKYGIEGSKPIANKLYKPLKFSKEHGVNQPTLSNKQSWANSKQPKLKEKSQFKNSSKGNKNEIRNIRS